MAKQTFYIRLRGQVSGPFDLNELHRRKRLGMFTRVHEVSVDGVHWQPFSKLSSSLLSRPESAPAKPKPRIPAAKPPPSPPPPPKTQRPVPPSPPPLPPPPEEEAHDTRGQDRMRRLCLIESVCLAVVLLLCTFLPHTRQDGRLTWWWGEWTAGNWGLGLACIYAILVAIAVLPVAVKGSTLVRGWVFLACAVIGLLIFSVTPLTAPRPCAAVSASVLGAGVLAALCATLLARPSFPGQDQLKALRGVAGGAGGILAVVAGSTAVVALLSVRVEDTRPAWAILGAVLTGIAWAVGVVASGIGLLSMKSGISDWFRKSGAILSLVCLGLVALAGAVVGLGAAQQSEGRLEGARFLLVQLLRLLVSSYSLCVLLAVGIVVSSSAPVLLTKADCGR